MPREPLLTVDDLAAYLGVSRRFVYRLTHEHRIAFTLVGGELRFTESAVAAYLTREETAAVPRDATPAAEARARHRVVRPRTSGAAIRARVSGGDDEVRPSW